MRIFEAYSKAALTSKSTTLNMIIIDFSFFDVLTFGKKSYERFEAATLIRNRRDPRSEI